MIPFDILIEGSFVQNQVIGFCISYRMSARFLVFCFCLCYNICFVNSKNAFNKNSLTSFVWDNTFFIWNHEIQNLSQLVPLKKNLNLKKIHSTPSIMSTNCLSCVIADYVYQPYNELIQYV
jgi:hypothetical protein